MMEICNIYRFTAVTYKLIVEKYKHCKYFSINTKKTLIFSPQSISSLPQILMVLPKKDKNKFIRSYIRRKHSYLLCKFCFHFYFTSLLQIGTEEAKLLTKEFFTEALDIFYFVQGV